MRIIGRPEFYICGYATKTTLENNDGDIGQLYKDFCNTGKEQS